MVLVDYLALALLEPQKGPVAAYQRSPFPTLGEGARALPLLAPEHQLGDCRAPLSQFLGEGQGVRA